MPIYDYACTDCGHRFEHMHEIKSAGEIKCPSCGSSSISKLVSMPGIIGTSAKHRSSQTCCGRSERCDKTPCSSDGQCHR